MKIRCCDCKNYEDNSNLKGKVSGICKVALTKDNLVDGFKDRKCVKWEYFNKEKTKEMQ